jgi:hypothetical protein
MGSHVYYSLSRSECDCGFAAFGPFPLIRGLPLIPSLRIVNGKFCDSDEGDWDWSKWRDTHLAALEVTLPSGRCYTSLDYTEVGRLDGWGAAPLTRRMFFIAADSTDADDEMLPPPVLLLRYDISRGQNKEAEGALFIDPNWGGGCAR